jgi:LPXTG-motif cell wall-anchored protein
MSYHGLGQSSTTTATTSVSVASIQCALRARGASIVVDGKFGPNTRSALQSQQTSFLPSVIGLLFDDARTGATSLTINKTFYEWLIGGSPCRTATAQPTSSSPSPEPSPDGELAPITEDGPAAWKTWVPVGGAVALVGLGIFFMRKRRRS